MKKVTEIELHAYVDGQLDSARRLEVEAYLAANPVQAERVRAYALQKENLHTLFDPTLDEAIPEALRPRPTRIALKPKRYAALLVAAMIGASLGWTVRGPSSLPIAQTMPQRAAMAHLVYVPEILHPVEVSAKEEAHLTQWLSKRLGGPVHAPQLRELGFELVGGRLLPDQAGPAAQFMYQDGRGERLTLYVRNALSSNRETAFRYAQEGKVGVFYWVDGPFGYALTGEFERKQLLRVAESVYRAFNP